MLKHEADKQFKVVENNGLYEVVRMYLTPSYKERVYSKHIIKEHADNEIKAMYS